MAARLESMSTVFSHTLETNSAAETEAVGIQLACAAPGGLIITLSGELGAGKTVLVRGIACGLSMPAGVAVTSPTYVLQHIYRGGRLTLYHIDAYRMVGGTGELEASGLTECFNDDNGLVCVEWPERLADFPWPEDRIAIHIDHYEPQKRKLVLTASGPRSMLVVKQMVK
jgi:tRNA threonylcarbamoyladenosine biosynthesis protein TsaE